MNYCRVYSYGNIFAIVMVVLGCVIGLGTLVAHETANYVGHFIAQLLTF